MLVGGAGASPALFYWWLRETWSTAEPS